MNSPASASDLDQAFEQLHPKIRRWIRDQNWPDLRKVQKQATVAIIGTKCDLLISANTAAGKTEAAFLPVLTEVAYREDPGFSVLYISPLKALINDQHRRLEELCDRLELPLVKWHGDAPAGPKERARRSPQGIALITPESIEAMLVRRPGDAKRLLGSADFIIIDEIHSFLSGPRGLHVASLLRRIDAMSAKSARRVGLSATIGDKPKAKAWLRPGAPERVTLIEDPGGKVARKVSVMGYVEPPELDDPDRAEGVNTPDDVPRRIALDDIADRLFDELRGTNNLVFGGSRRTVESMADRLRRRAEDARLPNEFYPHHGSLSKAIREELELRLKDSKLPTSGVCTSTLELGIDIGSVRSVSQIGAPRSLSALKQRLGRTGRRPGTPQVLGLHVREPYIGNKSGLLDKLRMSTIRAVAAVRLLDKFVEPPSHSRELASTLIHQILAVIVEYSGIKPRPLYDLLCGPGVFSSITTSEFAMLLKHLAIKEIGLIEQADSGVLMLGPVGEDTVRSRDFYAVFESSEEWRLTIGSKTLGMLPIAHPVHVDGLIVFAGQRWIIKEIDEKTRVLLIAPHPGGVVPRFDRVDGEQLHDRVVAEIREVYHSSEVPDYLDERAAELLAEGRKTFRQWDLGQQTLVPENRDTHVFLWRGSQATAVFSAALAGEGFECAVHDLGVTVSPGEGGDLRSALRKLAADHFVDALDLARHVANISAGKFGEQVPHELACAIWARQNSELAQGIPQIAEQALNGA